MVELLRVWETEAWILASLSLTVLFLPLQCAVRLGLEDAELLAMLGKEYAGADGSARAAENLLRAAVAKRPDDAESRAVLDGLIVQRGGGGEPEQNGE